jgi:hypothetical protein
MIYIAGYQDSNELIGRKEGEPEYNETSRTSRS